MSTSTPAPRGRQIFAHAEVRDLSDEIYESFRHTYPWISPAAIFGKASINSQPNVTHTALSSANYTPIVLEQVVVCQFVTYSFHANDIFAQIM
jgi:hypothetical protein